MIPYEELDRALARWKARTHGGMGEGSGAIEISGVAVVAVETVGSVPGEYGDLEVLPPPPDRTGEIDLGDAVVETYEDDSN